MQISSVRQGYKPSGDGIYIYASVMFSFYAQVNV